MSKKQLHIEYNIQKFLSLKLLNTSVVLLNYFAGYSEVRNYSQIFEHNFFFSDG